MNNTEIVREAYHKFGNGDIGGLLELMTEDVVWITPQAEGSPLGGTRHGHDETAKFFGLLDESENITEFEPREFIAEGDKVVTVGKTTAVIRETGRSYATEWVHIFTLRDGKISGFHEFFDTAAVERAFHRAEAV